MTISIWQHGGGLTSTQGQALKLIWGPIPTAKTRLLSFNRIKSRVVTGLLTGHNTLRRHLYIMGLIDSPLCRRCGVEEETSAHVLCKCEALVSLRHVYLGSSFLDPQDVKSLSLEVIWNFSKGIGLSWLGCQITGHKRPVKKAYVHRDPKGWNSFTIQFHSILFHYMYSQVFLCYLFPP